jgi:UDP-N-acetylmuramoyl-tripeptide--D-alanyl-D-alanine ligase
MAHVKYMGDLDGVARAKGELVSALPPSGLAVLNFDNPRV